MFLGEAIDRGSSVIELDVESADGESGESEPDPMPSHNGSIRSFDTNRFRVPTFVRKQID